jgi:hypothetical protein
MSAQVLLLGLLFVVLLQSRTAGYWIQASRPVSSTVVFLLLMGFCVLARDPREYSVLQWVALGSLATVLGIFFYHGLAINEVSGMARVPFWYGVIMAVGVVVLPQYVSRRAFLWAVNRFAAVLVLVTLPVYVYGEYSMFGMPFRFHARTHSRLSNTRYGRSGHCSFTGMPLAWSRSRGPSRPSGSYIGWWSVDGRSGRYSSPRHSWRSTPPD